MSKHHSRERIERVEIFDLFGWLHHDIPFHTNDRITIIHGPNGVGKTTILRLVSCLFESDLLTVARTNFSQLMVHLVGGKELTIERTIGSGQPRLQLALRVGRRIVAKDVFEGAEFVRAGKRGLPLGIIDDIVPSLQRVGPEEWHDRNSGAILTYAEVMSRYGEMFPAPLRIQATTKEQISDFLTSVDIHFIETQRLLSLQRPEPGRYRGGQPDATMQPTVKQYASEMADKIKEVLRTSGALSASLDRTFPARLLRERVLPEEATEDRIREKYKLQSEYRNRLMVAGLLEAEEPVDLPLGKLDSAERRVLWHYLADVDRKLGEYKELLDRVELLKEILSDKGFLRKSLVVDKESGYKFVGEPTGSGEGGAEVPLSSLSSGEQHELVLIFRLLFKAKAKALILIDEPELSLHVTWQHKFLNDMEKISRVADVDFLVATHSPAIVRDRRRLMVPLSTRGK